MNQSEEDQQLEFIKSLIPSKKYSLPTNTPLTSSQLMGKQSSVIKDSADHSMVRPVTTDPPRNVPKLFVSNLRDSI